MAEQVRFVASVVCIDRGDALAHVERRTIGEAARDIQHACDMIARDPLMSEAHKRDAATIALAYPSVSDWRKAMRSPVHRHALRGHCSAVTASITRVYVKGQ